MNRVCDENCFACRYPDCIWPQGSDEKKAQRRAYLRIYYARKRAEKAAQRAREEGGQGA